MPRGVGKPEVGDHLATGPLERPDLAHGPTPQGRLEHPALAAVEAAQRAWRSSNPWHELCSDIKRRHGKANPAKAAVARKVLIAAWHILAREEPFRPSARRAPDPAPASSSIRMAA